jgi:hypothetical protein
MTDKPAESSLLQATTKNIKDLQHAVHSLEGAAASAQVQATKAETAAECAVKEARRWRLLSLVLAFFVAVAVVASGLSIYNWVQQANATTQLRTQAIASCEHNNTQRQAEIKVWNRALNNFLALNIQLVVFTITPVQELEATKAFVTTTEKYLNTQLAPRDCTQAYSTKAGNE